MPTRAKATVELLEDGAWVDVTDQVRSFALVRGRSSTRFRCDPPVRGDVRIWAEFVGADRRDGERTLIFERCDAGA